MKGFYKQKEEGMRNELKKKKEGLVIVRLVFFREWQESESIRQII